MIHLVRQKKNSPFTTKTDSEGGVNALKVRWSARMLTSKHGAFLTPLEAPEDTDKRVKTGQISFV